MSSKISPEEPIAIITQAELDALHTRLDNLETAATQRIGLRRELELELFCEVLPIQSDGGEASYQRALAEIRRLKAQAPAAEVREALVELVRLKDLKFAHPEKYAQQAHLKPAAWDRARKALAQPDLHSHPAAGSSTPQVLSGAPASALPAEVREVLESLIADWRQEAIFSHARGNTQESGAFDECAGDLEARLRALAGAGI